jgi:hypothetical protein
MSQYSPIATAMGTQMFSLFLLGTLAGAVLTAAIYHGTEARWNRRKTSLSRTPLSIQTLFVRDAGTGRLS